VPSYRHRASNCKASRPVPATSTSDAGLDCGREKQLVSLPGNSPAIPFTCASELARTVVTPAKPITGLLWSGTFAASKPPLRLKRPTAWRCHRRQTNARAGEFATERICAAIRRAPMPTNRRSCKTCKGTRTSPAGTCSNVDKRGGQIPKSACAKHKDRSRERRLLATLASCNGKRVPARRGPRSTGVSPASCPLEVL